MLGCITIIQSSKFYIFYTVYVLQLQFINDFQSIFTYHHHHHHYHFVIKVSLMYLIQCVRRQTCIKYSLHAHGNVIKSEDWRLCWVGSIHKTWTNYTSFTIFLDISKKLNISSEYVMCIHNFDFPLLIYFWIFFLNGYIWCKERLV